MNEETNELLTEVVNQGLRKLKELDPVSPEYGNLANTVVKLHEQHMAEVKVETEVDEHALTRGAESEKQLRDEEKMREETRQTWLKVGADIGKTVLLIAANGLWMHSIMRFEQTGNISSKAFGFIGKPKIF